MIYELTWPHGVVNHVATSNGVLVETADGTHWAEGLRVNRLIEWCQPKGIRVRCVSDTCSLKKKGWD